MTRNEEQCRRPSCGAFRQSIEAEVRRLLRVEPTGEEGGFINGQCLGWLLLMVYQWSIKVMNGYFRVNQWLEHG